MPVPSVWKDRLALPVVASPMFIVSGLELVKAECRAGVVGTFPALNQRSSEGFADWLDELNDMSANEPTTAPYGVNLIVHRSNPRWEQDLKICVEKKVPLVITSLGAVDELVNAVHSYGGRVFHDVINRRHAEKAAQAGVDGLIAVSAGAGGHAGTLSPFALVSEIRQFFDKTLLLAGCLNTGRDIATAQMMGADMAYMGTRFIATKESNASDDNRQMILQSQAKDIFYTDKVSGVHGNFLLGSLAKVGIDPNDVAAKSIDFGNELDQGQNKAWKDLWSAGQGVGGIQDVPSVAELCQRLGEEYRRAIQSTQAIQQDYLD